MLSPEDNEQHALRFPQASGIARHQGMIPMQSFKPQKSMPPSSSATSLHNDVHDSIASPNMFHGSNNTGFLTNNSLPYSIPPGFQGTQTSPSKMMPNVLSTRSPLPNSTQHMPVGGVSSHQFIPSGNMSVFPSSRPPIPRFPDMSLDQLDSFHLGPGSSNVRRDFGSIMRATPSTTSQPSFQITDDDFPRLGPESEGGALGPGTSDGLMVGVGQSSIGSGLANSRTSSATNVPMPTRAFTQFGTPRPSSTQQPQQQSMPASTQNGGIHFDSDFTVSNIPGNMVGDSFGLVGLASYLKIANGDQPASMHTTSAGVIPDTSVALGLDLTGLGLNMSLASHLHPLFISPYDEGDRDRIMPHTIDVVVPPVYEVYETLSSKLSPFNATLYNDELLITLFYMFAGDLWQIWSAAELCNRGWHYYKPKGAWMRAASHEQFQSMSAETLAGVRYLMFDLQKWALEPVKFDVLPSDFEDPPGTMPPPPTNMGPTTHGGGQAPGQPNARYMNNPPTVPQSTTVSIAQQPNHRLPNHLQQQSSTTSSSRWMSQHQH